jgi:predicted secreted Zn-dependent protease
MIRQSLFLPLTALPLVLWGCAGFLPTPQQEWVRLEISRSTRYYLVRGATTGAIFESIDGNRLFDDKARRAVGVTSAQWDIAWEGIETSSGLCSPSMTITLKLIVTLPQHDHLNDLPQDIRTNWQRFAARVAAHEQRHVDIYLEGAKTMKTRMEVIVRKSSSCSELEKEINNLLVSQQAETGRVQDQFHVKDEARIQKDRKPLQDLVDLNRARLATIESEIRGLDQTLNDLKHQVADANNEVSAVKVEMAKFGGSPLHCSQSPLTSRALVLCHQHNRLVESYNAVVGQHNRAVSRHADLVGEYNRVIAITNDLVEALNWTR